MRLIDISAIVHIQLFDEEHEEYFTKQMTVGRMIEEYTEEMEIETVDAIPVKWLTAQAENPSNSDAVRNAIDHIVYTLWAERREE